MCSPLDTLVHEFQTTHRRMAFTGSTPRQVDVWRSALRSKLWELSGLDHMAAWQFDLEANEGEIERLDGYTRQRVELRTAPGYTMPLYVLRPEGEGPFTPIVALHGHGAGKSDIVGLAANSAAEEHIKALNYAYGLEAVRHGYIVFAPDKRGFGERYSEDRDNCRMLATTALQLGMSVIGLHTWDNMRLIDWLLQRSDVQGESVGCIGLSGGGGGTMWLAAMDERVGCAVISGHLGNYDNGSFGCICNAVPELLRWADRGDIAGLISPRPLLVESADHDQCYSREATLRGYETVERVYAAADLADRLDIDLFEGRHEWSGRKAWDWLHRWLRERPDECSAPQRST